MDKRVEIVQTFASVAEHPEQCYNFDIQGNLDTFFQCHRSDINFSEAAFLIYDAARIYGRKVDYLEQVLLDFNQRSATNVSKAMAEVRAMAEKAADGEKNDKKDKKAEELREKREREKDRALKRAKRMVKVTSKVEFKPKPFEIASFDQISLNLFEERTEFEQEEEFDQLRMKNVFPHINVLQSNMQNNNTFYDNLNIEENDVENPDSLRDFRIFMDTIDEPMFVRHEKGKKIDPRYEQEYKRSVERIHQKYSNLYLPADYIKETYGIILKDNSDYLNMLKYTEEYERLNLRKLTIEQLSKLKVGTYLNNILHGNKQDCEIPEFDSGIEVDGMVGNSEPSLPLGPDFDGHDETMAHFSANDTITNEDEDMLNISIIPPPDNTMNETQQIDQPEQQNTSNDSLLETSVGDVNSSLETTKQLDRTDDLRQSLDDGICLSECNSPSQQSEAFEGFDSTDLAGVDDLNQLNGIINAAGETQKIKVPELESNIFVLPEKLLRRPKIFALTDEFELWMAARKRKFGTKPDPPSCGKLLKLSNGVLIRSDPDSDGEEFLGFDEDYALHTAPSAVVEEPSPATIVNRTCSSDSGISPERPLNGSGDECNLSQNTTNDASYVNDSGVADLNSSAEATTTTLNGTTTDTNTNSETTLNTTTDSVANADQTANQETDLSVFDANINANSTKIQNETASIITGFDSGFAELESQLDSIGDETSCLDATANNQPTNELNTNQTPDGDIDSVLDEAIDCSDDHHDDDIMRQQRHEEEEEDEARAEGLSDMMERVHKWHEMLRPVLANCEKRNNFDIHALGTDIIDLYPADEEEKTEPTEITFNDIMKDRDETYTARYFLSLLLLTNTKNVHLKVMHPEDNGKVVCSKDDIRIKLRSRTRHLDEVNKIDQHLIEGRETIESSTTTNKTIDMDYTDDGEAEAMVAGPSKKVRGKKTAQKRKWNA